MGPLIVCREYLKEASRCTIQSISQIILNPADPFAKGLAPGLYHYHPVHHRLETIRKGAMQSRVFRYCAGQKHAKNAAALFLMTAVFERSMWKYHMGRAYRVVTLDAGHLCQTLCLVATWLGLAPFCTAALKDTLIEQDLGIDGIRESVLYVAGVGLPLASERM